MKKIPTVFERDWNGDRSRVVNHVHEGCEWVLAGEGVATKKLDGTSCMVRGGKLYKRREFATAVLSRMTDQGFQLEDIDPKTEKVVGWMPVGDGSEDRWHREAFNAVLPDGTYELVGPKVQGNPEGYPTHTLIAHSPDALGLDADPPPRDFNSLRDWLAGRDMEGIVFHHPDGRMAKIKLRDFGLKRPPH